MTGFGLGSGSSDSYGNISERKSHFRTATKSGKERKHKDTKAYKDIQGLSKKKVSFITLLTVIFVEIC